MDVVVARTGNYTTAAGHLHVTQSAVSHAIRKLEESVGQPLVEWRARRFSLTEDGEYLHQVCERIFRDLEDAEQRLVERGRKITHTVVLGATVEFGTMFLVRRMQPLLERHPELHLDFRFSHNLVQPLLQDEIDLAVDCKPHLHPSVDQISLFREKYVVIASPEFLEQHDVRNPQDLQTIAVLSLDKRADWWSNLLKAVPSTDRPVLGRIVQINHIRGIINAALSGIGVGLVPAYTVLGELAESSLVVLFPDLKLLDDQFCIYQKKSRANREKNQLVTRYLRSLDSDEFGDSIRPITR